SARYKYNVNQKVIQARILNRSSTSSERHNYLEQLIEQDNDIKDNNEDICQHHIVQGILKLF
ncbi:unnamed protein product, partial [Rotaria sp. Silwood1]